MQCGVLCRVATEESRSFEEETVDYLLEGGPQPKEILYRFR
jgi:hypothetical protein